VIKLHASGARVAGGDNKISVVSVFDKEVSRLEGLQILSIDCIGEWAKGRPLNNARINFGGLTDDTAKLGAMLPGKKKGAHPVVGIVWES